VVFITGTIVQSRRSQTKAITPPNGNARRDIVDRRPAHARMSITPPLKGDEFEIYICYSRTHLRPGAAIDLAMQNHRLDDLVTAGRYPTQTLTHKRMVDVSTTTNLFPLTLLSFATILYGIRHHISSTTHTGYTLHSTALQTLNRTLSHPSCHTSDAVLLSVATLAILEALVPTSPKAYLNHMLGLERLLQLRDPTDSKYTSPLSLALYKSVRHMVLFAALTTGRSCVLARREWKAVLRGCCRGEEEGWEQDLFDVLADCTVLGVGRDRLAGEVWGEEEGFRSLRDELLRRSLGLRAQLYVWKRRWESDERNVYVETRTIHRAFAPDVNPPTLTFFEFSNESVAAMFMLYNTALIHVLHILSSLSPQNPGTHHTEHPASPLFITQPTSAAHDLPPELRDPARDEYIAAERSAALNICRCIPYYSACAPIHTSPVVHWAVKTAWTTLRRDEFAEGKAMTEYLRAESREVTATVLWSG